MVPWKTTFLYGRGAFSTSMLVSWSVPAEVVHSNSLTLQLVIGVHWYRHSLVTTTYVFDLSLVQTCPCKDVKEASNGTTIQGFRRSLVLLMGVDMNLKKAVSTFLELLWKFV